MFKTEVMHARNYGNTASPAKKNTSPSLARRFGTGRKVALFVTAAQR